MTKKVVVLLLVFLLTVGIVSRARAANGNPWGEIQAAIANLQQQLAELGQDILGLQEEVSNIQDMDAELQNQIDQIELTPGPTGPPGPQGPQGEPGLGGSLNTYRVTSPIVFVNLASTANTMALCQVGDQLVSGGFYANGSTLQITQSRPDLVTTVPDAQGWFVEGSTANPPAGVLPGIGDIAAYALCNDVTPE